MKNFCRIFLLIGIFLCSSLLFVGCGDDLILVTGVDLYKEEIYANLNDTVDLSYKVYPSNASNAKVTFWSTDDSIASVSEDGKVTIKAYGETSIVIRSVDGGYEDSCRIITNIDPEAIEWDTSDGKLTKVSETDYSATSAMALNQVMKLKINYLIDGQESDSVTNKNVVFTSSNTSNIQIINSSEGIIKAVNNEKIGGDEAYSDITATIQTTAGELKITCRVYINEFSSLSHLYVNYKNYNSEVLNLRNGSETIYLTSGGSAVEFYSYITNMSSDVKTDYTMNIVSSDETLFSVENVSYEDGWYFFSLQPSMLKDGTGTLYLTTTCSDENGKTIRCNVNVTVQAEIAYAEASATDRVVGSGADARELILNDEIFSIDLTYYDSDSNVIEGASRDIYFDEFDAELLEYIADYGNNRFKVKKVPTNITKQFVISGYFYVENVEGSTPKTFEYKFYLRNNLEGLMVSENAKADTNPSDGDNRESIPNDGVSSITVPTGGSKKLYAYATSYDFKDTESSIVEIIYDDTYVSVQNIAGKDEFVITAKQKQGSTTLLFTATDGKIEVTYEVEVNIVAAVADIKTYRLYSNGAYTDETTTFIANTGITKIYFDIQPIVANPDDSDYKIENPTSIKVTSSFGVVKEEYIPDTNTIVRYVEIITSDIIGNSLDVVLTADRLLTSTTIRVVR